MRCKRSWIAALPVGKPRRTRMPRGSQARLASRGYASRRASPVAAVVAITHTYVPLHRGSDASSPAGHVEAHGVSVLLPGRTADSGASTPSASATRQVGGRAALTIPSQDDDARRCSDRLRQNVASPAFDAMRKREPSEGFGYYVRTMGLMWEMLLGAHRAVIVGCVPPDQRDEDALLLGSLGFEHVVYAVLPFGEARMSDAEAGAWGEQHHGRLHAVALTEADLEGSLRDAMGGDAARASARSGAPQPVLYVVGLHCPAQAWAESSGPLASALRVVLREAQQTDIVAVDAPVVLDGDKEDPLFEASEAALRDAICSARPELGLEPLARVRDRAGGRPHALAAVLLPATAARAMRPADLAPLPALAAPAKDAACWSPGRVDGAAQLPEGGAIDVDVDLIVMSRNRPMQAHALVESARRRLAGRPHRVWMMYRADEAVFQEGYELLQSCFNDQVMLVRDQPGAAKGFHENLQAILRNSTASHVVLMVDELVFIHDGDLRRIACALERDKGLSMAQLRLGTYMFGKDREKRLVRLEGLGRAADDSDDFNAPLYGYVPWRLGDPFAYVCNVDAVLIGRERLLQELQQLPAKVNNPMQLEQRWLQHCLADEAVNWHVVGEVPLVVNNAWADGRVLADAKPRDASLRLAEQYARANMHADVEAFAEKNPRPQIMHISEPVELKERDAAACPTVPAR